MIRHGVIKHENLSSWLTRDSGPKVITTLLQAHRTLWKTCRAIQTKEIVDLITDKLPDEFEILIDVPSDDEDIDKQVVNTRGNSENEFDDDNDKGGVLDDNDDKGGGSG